MEIEEKKDLKPDWKQYIPVYGVYRAIRDKIEGKPVVTILGKPVVGSTFGSTLLYATYHSVSSLGIRFGLEALINKL